MITPTRIDAENPEGQKKDALLFNDGYMVHIKIHDPSELGFSSQDIAMTPVGHLSGMPGKPSFRPSQIETSPVGDGSGRRLSESEP